MAGTIAGGRAVAKTNKSIYGADFYKRIGKIGGATPTQLPKGFAADRERARIAGTKGGTISRRRKV